MLHMQRFLYQAKSMSELRHACVVAYENAFHYEVEAQLSVGVVTEYCANGNLNDLLAYRGQLDEERKVSFAQQLASGLEYVHSSGFSHRNVKPSNVLLDPSGRVRIAEFGLATLAWEVKELLSTGKRERFCDHLSSCSPVSAAFFAPEVHDDLWAEAADVFSLGLIFACLAEPARFLCTVEDQVVVMPQLSSRKERISLGKFLHQDSSDSCNPTCLLGFSNASAASAGPTGAFLRLVNKMLGRDTRRRISMTEARFSLEQLNENQTPSFLDLNEPLQMENSWSCCCFQ